MPPPVLVSRTATLDALADEVTLAARVLAEHHWPGPLTLVCREQPSLHWDLGDTHGTVAVRMPADDIALALLERTGPLAVSSANATGQPAAADVTAAHRMLGDSVAVYLDAGRRPGGVPSTIVDATVEPPRVLRQGALELSELRRLVPAVESATSAEEDG